MTTQFRKDGHGQYRLVGPAAELVVGAVIEVPKKGSDVPVLKKVKGVTREFDVDGVPSVYASFWDCDACQTCRKALCQPAAPGQPDETQCQHCILEALDLLK